MMSGATALTPGATDALAATRSLPAKTAVEAVKPSAPSLAGGAVAGETTAPDFDEPVATGAVTSRYGVRRDPLTGRRRFHGGVDIAAERGTAIRAAAEGRVIYAGKQGGYGNTVIIEHEDGYRTRYAHADTLAVRAGDVIEAGQEIGTVGSTGRSTGPHLHFEVTKNGRRLNPKEIFR
jgi:murein DD-endopeptidase MepM/ murein hydrolase activator NlpD